MAALATYLVATGLFLSIKRMLLLDADACRTLYDANPGRHSRDRNDISFWLLFSTFFLSLALVKRYVELRTTTLVPAAYRRARLSAGRRGHRRAGRHGSAFSSALVLALYIDSDAVREYAHPYMIWPLAVIVLTSPCGYGYGATHEMHDDPVFITRDWRSQLRRSSGAAARRGGWWRHDRPP